VGGDVIVAVDGQPVKEFDDVVTYLARAAEVGQKITLSLLRQGQEETVQVELAARPKPEAQGAQAESGQVGGAWLGISGRTVIPQIAEAMGLPEDQQGVLVEQVEAGSPADQAGLRGSFKPAKINGQSLLVGGDIILEVNGDAVNQIEDLQSAIRQAQPGDEITLLILRNGDQMELPVTLGERPGNMQ
jgi:S1-C subfamily serine protease